MPGPQLELTLTNSKYHWSLGGDTITEIDIDTTTDNVAYDLLEYITRELWTKQLKLAETTEFVQNFHQSFMTPDAFRDPSARFSTLSAPDQCLATDIYEDGKFVSYGTDGTLWDLSNLCSQKRQQLSAGGEDGETIEIPSHNGFIWIHSWLRRWNPTIPSLEEIENMVGEESIPGMPSWELLEDAGIKEPEEGPGYLAKYLSTVADTPARVNFFLRSRYLPSKGKWFRGSITDQETLVAFAAIKLAASGSSKLLVELQRRLQLYVVTESSVVKMDYEELLVLAERPDYSEERDIADRVEKFFLQDHDGDSIFAKL